MLLVKSYKLTKTENGGQIGGGSVGERKDEKEDQYGKLEEVYSSERTKRK